MTDKQADFARDFRNAAKAAGHVKTLGDAIELPDQEDWNNIVRIINRYRKESIKIYGEDVLIKIISDAKKEHALAGNRYERYSSEYQLVNKDSNLRHIFELPPALVRMIESVYPVMFSSKKHFAWFARNFKELRIADKY